jgi:hypothetical protein
VRALPARQNERELALPADEAGLVAAVGRSEQGDETERRHRLGLALDRERLDRLGLDSLAHELQGGLADQDLTWSCCLLEAGGRVDRIPGGQALLGASYDLAGGEPDSGLDAKLWQGITHLDRRSTCSESVILVHFGDAEDRHDRIADELLHRASVRLDDLFHPLEVAGEERS